MAGWLVYCFVVWAGLIAMTMLVNRALAESDRRRPPATAATDGDGPT
jgi:hypothetical protein